MISAVRRQIMLCAAFAGFSTAASADGGTQEPVSGPSAGIEFYASTDSDKTDVIKLLGRAALFDKGADQYAGIAVEQAWFTPLGQRTHKVQRVYADLVGKVSANWYWKAKLGTDGRTWLGSANLRAKDWSKEVFVEREIVETPRGVEEGLYYTFLGASADVSLGKSDTFTVTGAVQSFTGKNDRLHLRANLVHVVKADIGLSLQLRTRYFHSTEPGEFDYYSPRDFFQALPVVQMRRFTSSGWMILGAAGFGAQRATGSEWTTARLAELRIESPHGARRYRAFGQIQYSNNSLNGSGNYHYVMARLGLTKAL